ncbi:MAG: hypothetical protein E7411_03570 [Ruminococcaceae bacterium]|nr:hypothetical protein [Oscillospiraceae bacterium]
MKEPIKRTMCCPKCKSTDLIIPDNSDERVVCRRCEHSFHSLDYYKAKKITLNRIFTVSLIVFVITLILGTCFFFLPVYGEYNLPVQSLIARLSETGISERALVTAGVVFFVISLIAMLVVFVSAYYSQNYHERRMYLRKHGFIYEKRNKVGSHRN